MYLKVKKLMDNPYNRTGNGLIEAEFGAPGMFTQNSKNKD